MTIQPTKNLWILHFFRGPHNHFKRETPCQYRMRKSWNYGQCRTNLAERDNVQFLVPWDCVSFIAKLNNLCRCFSPSQGWFPSHAYRLAVQLQIEDICLGILYFSLISCLVTLVLLASLTLGFKPLGKQLQSTHSHCRE